MQDDFGLMQIKTPVIQVPDEKNSKEWDIPIHYYFDTFFIFSFSALVLK